ncbi:MAG: lysophospholipid acyltransferase family protein [Proteobacteria bacterium]|nr:lysophospholipid acyltransferase family protein [Pseudomonadota bacterium]
MSNSDALDATTPAAVPAKRKKPVKQFVVRHILPPIARGVYGGMARTWHYTTENEPILTDLLKGDKPIVGAFLHARTFQLLYYFSRPHRGRWMLMCSKSSDGDLMTKVERGLGYRVARGSSGSGGARALAEMIKAQREDRHLNSCLAVDGSRGPRGIAQLGILTLARKSSGVLLPVAASASKSWILGSWDRTVIPKPGAQIRILIGEPIELPPKMDEQQAESARLELQRRLIAMHIELDARTGFSDSAPLQAPGSAQ